MRGGRACGRPGRAGGLHAPAARSAPAGLGGPARRAYGRARRAYGRARRAYGRGRRAYGRGHGPAPVARREEVRPGAERGGPLGGGRRPVVRVNRASRPEDRVCARKDVCVLFTPRVRDVTAARDGPERPGGNRPREPVLRGNGRSGGCAPGRLLPHSRREPVERHHGAFVGSGTDGVDAVVRGDPPADLAGASAPSSRARGTAADDSIWHSAPTGGSARRAAPLRAGRTGPGHPVTARIRPAPR